MIQTKCSACGLPIRASAWEAEFENKDFIRRCKTFKSRATVPHVLSQPFQQKVECSHLNESIRLARRSQLRIKEG